jgi:hypothetical protein
MIRRAARLTATACAIAAALSVGIGALLLSLFRIGASANHWRSLGLLGVLVAIGVAVHHEWPGCPQCRRRTFKRRTWCDCGMYLGAHAERWEVQP